MQKIESGIYRDECNNDLIFVLGLGSEGTRNSLRIISHSLSKSAMEWRVDMTEESFFEMFEKNGRSFPRFTKLKSWDLPNILPGKRIKSTGIDDKGYTIVQVYEKGLKIMVEIKAESSHVGPVSLPIDNFETSGFSMV